MYTLRSSTYVVVLLVWSHVEVRKVTSQTWFLSDFVLDTGHGCFSLPQCSATFCAHMKQTGQNGWYLQVVGLAGGTNDFIPGFQPLPVEEWRSKS